MSVKPNLLYIHSDQHNPHVTGCYGDRIVQTPNLDRLAKQGVVLGNVYCPSPICVPSRMSMLTGRYPHENEVWMRLHRKWQKKDGIIRSYRGGRRRPNPKTAFGGICARRWII